MDQLAHELSRYRLSELQDFPGGYLNDAVPRVGAEHPQRGLTLEDFDGLDLGGIEVGSVPAGALAVDEQQWPRAAGILAVAVPATLEQGVLLRLRRRRNAAPRGARGCE